MSKGVFSMGVFFATCGLCINFTTFRISQNNFKDDVNNHIKDDLQIKDDFQNYLAFSKNQSIFSLTKRRGKSCCVWMDPHLLFCDDSGAPILKKKKQHSREENPPERSTQNRKVHPKQVHLNNFHWVPDSRHREEGKSSRELFEKVRVNALVFFGISGFWVGFGASKLHIKTQKSSSERVFLNNFRCAPDSCDSEEGLVAPSTGWMLYYLCFSPSTAIGPPLR